MHKTWLSAKSFPIKTIYFGFNAITANQYLNLKNKRISIGKSGQPTYICNKTELNFLRVFFDPGRHWQDFWESLVAGIRKGDMLEIQFALLRFQAIKRTGKVKDFCQELQNRISANLELSTEIMSLRQWALCKGNFPLGEGSPANKRNILLLPSPSVFSKCLLLRANSLILPAALLACLVVYVLGKQAQSIVTPWKRVWKYHCLVRDIF